MVGKFLVVGLDWENFTDLPADLMAKYKEQFRHPETFCKVAGKVIAVKLPVHDPAKQASARSGHDHDAR